LYFVDEFRRVTFSQSIDAEIDEEAVLKGREIAGRSPLCEVWNDHRLIAKITCGRVEVAPQK
jgi:hypothetical protein